jgi:hypothetical protein
MPLHFHRDDTHCRVILTGQGAVNLNDWTEAMVLVVEEEVWGYATLYDFTTPNALLPNAAEVTEITRLTTELCDEHGPRGPVAFAVSDVSEYHHTRGWVDTVGKTVSWNVGVFRTRQDAERWLDVPGS